jgi:hypothetical protein
MTVPANVTWASAALVAAHTAVLALLAGGSIKVRSASGALLATLTLPSPAGTVNALTGQLTLVSVSGYASAYGIAAYGELCEPGGSVVCALPCMQGDTPVAGRLVFSSTTLLGGGYVSIISATIG